MSNTEIGVEMNFFGFSLTNQNLFLISIPVLYLTDQKVISLLIFRVYFSSQLFGGNKHLVEVLKVTKVL